ncbi:MAG: hypothetical protein GF401_15655 [Chitinivibrionales bacterium]|nr:hypothetical protein [Chitinivibrionales bacterium]
MEQQIRHTLLFGILFSLVTTAVGGSIEDRAAKIHARHKDAVITVKLVTRQRMVVSGKEMDQGEHKQEVTGVIIDPSGLAVVSLFVTDPWANSSPAFGGEDNPDFSFETEISDVKMLMPGSDEVQARVLIRDRDLDLVFISPTDSTGKSFPFIDFSNSAKATVLNECILLGRLGKAAGRTASVTLCRVKAIVNKPRRFYIPDGTAIFDGLGRPAFTQNGKTLGILLMRVIPSPKGEFNETPIILPAEDIIEVMGQIPERDQ